MDENFSVRHATVADLDLISAMIREFYDYFGDLVFDDRETMDTLRSLLSDSALGTVLLPCVDGKPIGYLALMYCLSLEFHGRYAFVDEFYIQEEHRRRGYGRRTLDYADAFCREAKVRVLFLEVDREDEGNQRLYRNAGFQPRKRYDLLYKRIE